MKVTSQLKAWLQSEKGVKPDATEQDYRQAAAKALTDDTNPLSAEKFAELTAGEAVKPANAMLAMMEKMNARLDEQDARFKSIETGGHRAEAPIVPAGLKAAIMGGASEIPDASGQPRIKRAAERYNKARGELRFPEPEIKNERYALHPRKGQLASYGSAGRHCGEFQVGQLSELEKACCGSFIKFSIHKAANGFGPPVPHNLRMNDQDWDLVQYMIEECEWGGVLHGEGSDFEGAVGLNGKQRLIKGAQFNMQKALLDDNTSGGLEAAPIFFDEMLITTPLLHGELFPSVEVINVTRGRRIEGVTMSNVTLGAATEGSTITLFNTAAFIAAFDTTIFVCMGAIEIGLDFLSDSPIDIAGAVAKSYQERLLSWLDEQIAIGDGTTEPEGLLNSGATSVGSTNTSAGPWTIGDELALMFAVAKQYQTGFDRSRIRYSGNEVTYRRLRSIQVTTSDQRLVQGMDVRSYMILDQPYAVNGNWTNRQLAYANLARYRMYRRLGMTVRWETAGATLGRSNTGLLIARSRWGGQLTDALAASLCTDGMS